MAEIEAKNIIPNDIRSVLVSTLQFEIEKLDYNGLKAGKDNKDAQSGATMFVDINRMNFIINGKKIDRNLVENLRKEAEDNSNNKELKRFIDRFDDKTIEVLTSEPERRKALSNIRNSWYKQYNYQVLTEAFLKIFQHAKAKVPSKPIMQELITNCNQAGYACALSLNVFPSVCEYGLLSCQPKELKERAVYIDCMGPSCIKIKLTDVISLRNEQNPLDELALLHSSLEFKLQSQGDEVKYTDGKLSLTLPKELAQDKNLLAKIIEWFKELFGIEVAKGPMVIEHSFDKAEVDKPQTRMEGAAAKPLQVRQVSG